MARSHYVYGYDAEPADERPTDYGSTSFGPSGVASLYTAPAPWSTTEHSTFDEPSHVIERVRERRQQRHLKARVAMLLSVLAASAAAAVAVLVTRA